MDDDVELIVPDNLDDDPNIDGIFPDFSQIQIQVHGADEQIIDNIEDSPQENEVFGTEEYLDDEDDIQEISDDTPEPEVITDDCKENIFIQNTDIQEFDIQDDMKDDCQEYLDNDKIPDKDIAKYDAVIEEYPNYDNVVIKEESFVVDDYTDFDKSVECNNDLSDDAYPHSNVIILGSKPCQSTSNSIIRRLLKERDSTDEVLKEYLDTSVCLEDWGPKLENNQCFCDECGTLFVTPNDLDAHNMMAHSFLVPVSKNVAMKSTAKQDFTRKSTGTIVVKNTHNKNIARKSTGSKSDSKFCNHCNKSFPDHTTLIKHLYEMLPLKQFACTICDAVFKTAKDLMDHNNVHVKHEKVKEKTDTGANKKQSQAIKAKQQTEIQYEAIPKSILFQCPKCGTHFVSAIVQYKHTMYCTPETKKKWKPCDICKRKIFTKDKIMHKKQHEICTKFRVLKVNNNMSERTMCKCPTCELHFSDYSIGLHLKDCGKIPAGSCKKCNLLLPKNRLPMHMKLHTRQNFRPKDYLFIDYCIRQISGTSTVKRKLAPPALPAKKIKLDTNIKVDKSVSERTNLVKLGNKYRMFFCSVCKGCCMWQIRRILHTNNNCIGKNKKLTEICVKCGLKFTKSSIKYHKTLHKQAFKITDCAFLDIHSSKRIIPTTPDYPQCKSCKIKFFDPKLLPHHICGEDYETCGTCGENYHVSAYDAHKEFHKLGKMKQAIGKIDGKAKIGQKIGTKLLPELMKKYESLNMMWNMIYCCKKCDIVTDQYDKAVEHSQGHLNQKVVTRNIKCYICNLKVEEACWSKHSDLHARMNINSKAFKILYYNPRKLLTEEWFELFESISEEQIQQVINKSVYSQDRSFKMRLLKEGRSEFTIHCCSDCKVCYRSNEIEKHVNGICKKSTNICKVCSIPFSDISTLKNHQILHLKGIKKEEFRVVIFTKEAKIKPQAKTKPTLKIKQISQKARLALAKMNKKINNKIKPANKGQTKTGNRYILHKCKKCKCCVHPKNVRHHFCYTESNRTKCTYCNQLFINRNVKKHEQRHLNHPDFTIKNITIKLFEPTNQDVKEIAKSLVKMVKPTKKPKPKAKVPQKIQPIDTVKEVKDSNVSTTTKTDTIYKCDCGLHYTSIKNIEKHVQICNSEMEISKENCSKCGLLFPTDTLVSHLIKHHSLNSKFIVELYQKEIDEVESTSDNQIPENKSNSNLTLYKCSECNVYFVNSNTCYKHVYKNHKPLNERYILDCKLCGLPFTVKTILFHVTKHHSKHFSLDNVLVEEYEPKVKNQPIKKQVYLAANKIQSLQVTSSIEESAEMQE